MTDHCDISVSIDADLQDDLNAIQEMIAAYQPEPNWFWVCARAATPTHRFKAKQRPPGFYKMMKWMGVNLVEDHAIFA